MLIAKEHIQTVIPQREPFILIDSLLQADEQGFASAYTIPEGQLFLNGNELSESALIENIAQTCAAGFGYLAQQTDPGEPKIGFIGAVTQVQPHSKAKTGETIHTEVKVISTFDTIHLVEGKAIVNDRLLLSCQMKIVVS